jgi:two-component system, sensor histidine kinase RegB
MIAGSDRIRSARQRFPRATIFIGDSLVAGLNIGPMFAVLLVIAASNLLWLSLTTFRARRGSPSGEPRLVEKQLVVDVALLTAMLWFAGGTSNPFAAFLTFQIALAGLLTTPRVTLGIAGLTILAAIVLVFAPPLPPLSQRIEQLANVVSLTTLTTLLAAFVAVYADRLDRLRRDNSRSEKLAVLGRLVGSMSHELNTPLATVLLLSKDLEKYGAEMDADETRALVQSIVSEAQRANDIVGLVRGHVVSDQVLEPIELSGFLQSLADAELDRLQFRGERRYDLGVAVEVIVMKRALVQVFVNLLKNAAEATRIGRKHTVTVGIVDMERAVEVFVEDRGPGFTEEILARLGEPFQTTKEAQGGMGLGLYVSAMLAKQMGSELAVRSVPDGGARVSLTLDKPTR